MLLKRINKIILVFILSAIGLWFIGIGEPFVGSYGANLNYFTLAAKNFIRFGYINLLFVPSYYAGPFIDTIPSVYLHHPVFYFDLVSLPFLLFGFYNWVASVTPLIFSLVGMVFLYKIGKEIWDKTIGLFAAFFYVVFPISAVFNRQTIFEPALLSSLLVVYYFYVKFLKTKERKYGIYLFLGSLLSIAIDWGAVYFIIPFFLLFPFLDKKIREFKPILYYLGALIIGLIVFVMQVAIWKGGFNDFINAVYVRQVDSELFSHSYPLVRLITTTIIRILIYFTPFVFISFILLFENIRDFISKKKLDLKSYTILFFFLFGIVNIVVLPTATFGHIYFLIYLTPFFAFTLSQFSKKVLNKSEALLFLFFFTVFLISSLVTYFKWQQVRKQAYRFDIAKSIDMKIVPYKTVGVRGFPGDVMEQYFLHPTVPLQSYTEFLNYIDQDSDNKVSAIFSCWDQCLSEDYEFVSELPYKKEQFGKNTWLVTNEFEPLDIYSKEQGIEEMKVSSTSYESVIIRMYRQVRDMLHVGQL